jgi:hypothetical protein
VWWHDDLLWPAGLKPKSFYTSDVLSFTFSRECGSAGRYSTGHQPLGLLDPR